MSTSKSKNNIVTGNQFAKRVVPLINNWDGYGYSNPKVKYSSLFIIYIISLL